MWGALVSMRIGASAGAAPRIADPKASAAIAATQRSRCGRR